MVVVVGIIEVVAVRVLPRVPGKLSSKKMLSSSFLAPQIKIKNIRIKANSLSVLICSVKPQRGGL